MRITSQSRQHGMERTAETMRGGRSTAEVTYYNGDRSAVGRFVTITDPQGKTHNPSCTSAAFGAFEDNAADEGFNTGWDICESWGMPANDESVLATVGDWLEGGTTECTCSDYDDIYGDRYSHVSRRESATRTADKQDQMEDRLLVLRGQMDHKAVRNALASEFYTSPEEQKAFKQGWDASAKPNRDLERSEKKWDGTPATDPVMGAWYDGWELVSRAL